jgi:hypothetical protein
MGFFGGSREYKNFRKVLDIGLFDLREGTAGDVGNIVANGGVLASDTTPTLLGNSTGITQELTWATANVDQVLANFVLPADFDGREDVIVELWVASGTSDAATFTIASAWNGGASVTDTASDAATLSATVHKITATISAADIPDTASYVSFSFTPGAHATDTIVLRAIRISYAVKNT